MQSHEYQVIPAPRRGEKARGVKTTPERFGLTLTNLMNQMATEGWEYIRADTLPCDERVGLTGRSTSYQTMLVFRRSLAEATDATDMAPLQVMPVGAVSPPAPRLGAAGTPEGPAPALGPAIAPGFPGVATG